MNLVSFFDNPWILILIVIWTLPWKGVAIWVAASQKKKGWFVALLVINTLAILEILYIFVFSKMSKGGKRRLDSDRDNKNTF